MRPVPMTPAIVPAVPPLALLQARLLSELFAKTLHENLTCLVLKGGMAMRVAHNNVRMTNDIDLDACGVSLQAVQRKLRHAIADANLEDWLAELHVSEPKQTDTTARWKIKGRVRSLGVELHMKIEVSFREHVNACDVRAVPYAVGQDEPTAISVYSDERLVANKIRALLGRDEPAPRDAVDLFVLFQSGVVPAPHLFAASLPARVPPHQAIQELWQVLEAMPESLFRAEVVDTWAHSSIPPAWEDWEGLKLEVGLQIERYFQAQLSGGAQTTVAPSAPAVERACEPALPDTNTDQEQVGTIPPRPRNRCCA